MVLKIALSHFRSRRSSLNYIIIPCHRHTLCCVLVRRMIFLHSNDLRDQKWGRAILGVKNDGLKMSQGRRDPGQQGRGSQGQGRGQGARGNDEYGVGAA